MAEDENGWPEYKRLVLNEIEDLKAANKSLHKVVNDLRVEVAKLKERNWIQVLIYASAAGGGSAMMEFFTK